MRTRWISTLAIGCALQLSSIGIAQVRDASVDDLIKLLDSREVERRRDAVYELVRRSDYSDAVIESLGKSSSDDDSQIRVQALTGLARAGNKSKLAMAALLKCLEHRDDQVRYRAAAALGAIGSESIESLQAVWPKASLDSKIAIAQAFAMIGRGAKPTIPLLLEGLEAKEGLPRYAAEGLIAIAPDDESILLKIANHSDVVTRKIGIARIAGLDSVSDAVTKSLQAAMNDSDPRIREAGIIAVAKSKLQVTEKATLIELALVDASPSVRAAGLSAMTKAALPAQQFSEKLAARLHSVDIEAANTIVKAIASFGPGAKNTIPAILTVASRDGIDQRMVSKCLASFGASVVPDLLAAIDRYPQQEATFSQSLGLIGEPAVESLTNGLSSPRELIRLAAVRALGGVRPMSKKVLQSLVRSTDDASATVREVAVASLIDIAKEGEFSKDATLKETLLRATRDPSPNVRAAAMQALRRFQFAEEPMRAAVDAGLKDPAPEVRSSTLSVLSDLPKLLRTRSVQLTELVSDQESGVRKNAAALLGKLDKKELNESIVKACVAALRDKDHLVRIAATESVKSLEIQDSSVLDSLSENLIDDNPLLVVTLDALSAFGAKANAILPAVTQLVSHEKADIRVAALNAFASIEKDSKQLVGRLVESLDDRDWEVRRCAGTALGKIGPDAKSAVPKLFGLLRSEQDKVFADSSLKEINAAPIEAIPMLIDKIDSNDRREAFYAVSLLGKIGPEAAESLPKLEAKLAKLQEELAKAKGGDKGRDEFRKKFLVEAIAAIKGEAKAK